MAGLSLAFLCWSPGPAAAFTCETPFSDGCHEQITAAALRTAGWPGGQAAPAVTHPDRVLVDNLLFHPPKDLQDRWAIAALIGVRHTDFGGNRPSSPDLLAAIHNDTEGQGAHCLRSIADDGVAGDATAVSACRAYILAEIEQAIGVSDAIDFEATVDVSLALKYEVATLALSRFAFHIGHALHALQDSFTHTFRHPDAPEAVLSVFNYVDRAFKRDYEPRVDGPAHSSAFDTCAPGENVFRVEQATKASVDLLIAASGAGTRSERLVQVGLVMDVWLTPSATPCDGSNGYCGVIGEDGKMVDALFVSGPDESDGGCASRPQTATPGGIWCVLLVLLFLRRRRLIITGGPA